MGALDKGIGTTQGEQLVRRYVSEVVNQGDRAVGAEVFAPGYSHHDPALPPGFGDTRERYLDGLLAMRDGLPDLTAVIDDTVADETTVAVRMHFTGVHRGDFLGIPPSGRRVNVTMSMFFRVDNGFLAEGWANFDALGMMRQLGVIPAAA